MPYSRFRFQSIQSLLSMNLTLVWICPGGPTIMLFRQVGCGTDQMRYICPVREKMSYIVNDVWHIVGMYRTSLNSEDRYMAM